MRTALALAALLLSALPAGAQVTRPDWSPWGGPDSPGGLFGGDPRGAIPTGRDGATHDEVWTWLRQRFDAADRDRSGTLTEAEIHPHPDARATFRAADVDRNGHLTPEELRPMSERWFRAHDADRNGRLTRREMQRR